jgi:hypothetical protein
MTQLHRKMLEELQRRNYLEITARKYLQVVTNFAQHFGKSPDKLGPDQLRTYQAYLLKECIGIGEEMRNGTRSIREVVQFDEEELTVEKIEKKTRLTLRIIDEIEKLYALGLKQAAEPLVTARPIERNLDRLGRRPPRQQRLSLHFAGFNRSFSLSCCSFTPSARSTAKHSHCRRSASWSASGSASL